MTTPGAIPLYLCDEATREEFPFVELLFVKYMYMCQSAHVHFSIRWTMDLKSSSEASFVEDPIGDMLKVWV